MNRIAAEAVVEEAVVRYPAAKVALSRYGLGAYEEAGPPRRPVSRFAEDRGIPVARLHQHHDQREKNILYPVFDRVTDEEERKELLRKCFPE